MIDAKTSTGAPNKGDVMTPHVILRRPRSLAFASAVLLSLGVAAPAALAADETIIADAGDGFSPGSDQGASRPPATFFSINAVLAKLDRQRGRGPEAVRLAALTPPGGVATDASPAVREAPAPGPEPFGLFTFRAPDGLLWRKWRGVEAAMTAEQTVLDRCRADARDCPSYAAQFLRLINAVGSKAGRERLEEANRAVNQAIRYVSDYAQHGEADRWSTPLATFATAKGDCEDYAIAKYVALTAAGFSRDDLQLVLVRDRAVRQDHAVLAARLDGHWLILDNRFSALKDDFEASSLTPLFAIDHHGVHLFAAPYAKRQLLDGEMEAAPAAAAGDAPAEWSGADDEPQSSASGITTLPLLM
jgi:predicted transglutaminase-like cysteine proteinase